MNDFEIEWNEHKTELLRLCSGDEAPVIADGSRGLAGGTPPCGDLGKDGGEAVCLPSPCALGCSFDRRLAHKIGRAVGSIAVRQGIGAVLSPDAGVVRSPFSGLLADRFGEDPYLCGALAGEWVKGVQSTGTAAVLARLGDAVQSDGKFACDFRMDARALHEVYLRPFEAVIRQASPRAVLCGTGRINGVYSGENEVLLTEILRRRWRFGGAVLADMRMLNPAEAMASGVDGSYPAGGARVRRSLARAVEEEELPAHYPARCAGRLREMTGTQPAADELLDPEDYAELTVKAAEQCAVLLKNYKNILPLPLSGNIALIGRFAGSPRIQRGGLHAVPVEEAAVPTLPGLFDDNQIHYRYCEGFREDGEPDEALLAEAVRCAASSEFAVVFVGLEDEDDNRSRDRRSCQLPRAQLKLLHAVAKANANTVVVAGGSALPRMNWIGKVKAVLYLPLAGQGTSEALFRLLFGFANPCGRLPVSYSVNEAEIPCGDTDDAAGRLSEMRESIYVGYRYYDKAGNVPAFPFGTGLSYTRFAYSSMRAVKCAEGWDITLDVKNIGRRDGAEIVQFYVEAPRTDRFRPVRELKQFHKIFLAQGEKRSVTVRLPREAFACYDAEYGRFRVNGGRYRVCAAASSTDIRAEVWLSVKGEPVPRHEVPPWYLNPVGRPKASDFRGLSRADEAGTEPAALSEDSTIHELAQSVGVFRLAERVLRAVGKKRFPTGCACQEKTDEWLHMPVNRLCGYCGGFYPMKLTRLLLWLAGRKDGKTA